MLRRSISRVSASSSTTSTVCAAVGAAVLLQRGGEPLPVDRLGEVVGRAEREAHVLVIHDGQHDDGNVRGGGSAFSAVSTAQPSMPGIITSSVMTAGWSSWREFEAALAVGGDFDAVAVLAERALHQVAHVGVVVDDEHRARAECAVAGRMRPTGRALRRCRGGSPTTCAGSVTVKVVPLPGSLSTVMSPPIIWQNFRLIARPRPVPPNLRVVEASACANAWKSRPICSGVMPMPVSLTREVSS